MCDSEMKVHTVGEDHTKQKIVACEVPVIIYQVQYKSRDSKHTKYRGKSVSAPFFGMYGFASFP
ncbi:MAG: hypothetical protein CMJ78_25115 [Planctomycetaceae bacterium]|nr:hypothetical protein [Planctomycetaceae bacterium]